MAKFAKGHAPHPKGGRPKGSPNKNSERAKRLISEGDDKMIVDRVLEAAKLGDIEARRIYFRHLRPAAPRSETYIGPVDYTAPKTIEDARAILLTLGERLARREISLEAHEALVDGVRFYLADKAAEQEKKIAAFEADIEQSKR
jgi:hypothetical protein